MVESMEENIANSFPTKLLILVSSKYHHKHSNTGMHIGILLREQNVMSRHIKLFLIISFWVSKKMIESSFFWSITEQQFLEFAKMLAYEWL